MEIQQHNGVVVEAAGSRQGFAKHQREGEVSRGEEGGARDLGCGCPPPPSIYMVKGIWGWAPYMHLEGGGGQGGRLAPQARWEAPPPPRVSNPRRLGPLGGTRAQEGLVPYLFPEPKI